MLALAAAAAIQCQAKSIGPASLHRGGTAGAACMLAAYKECRAAGYELSSFGVDTVRTETFRIVGCKVYVTESFRVVPQQPRVLGRFVCTRLRKTSTGNVVADRCSPRKTISLTTF
ncbi:MAG: hypothetical protein ACRDNM_04990 [Gaiellaceae bacterium]